MNKISLLEIFRKNKLKLIFTWVLVLLESGVWVLFPYVLGLAIDDLLKTNYMGLYLLVLSGLASLLIGGSRRFYDTRVYSSIYAKISPELVEQETKKGSSVSKKSARASLLTEFVEYLENSFPEIIENLIGLIGTLAVIFFLNKDVFYVCLLATALIVIVYALTSNKTYLLNKNYNEELEKQVEVLEKNKHERIKQHFLNIKKWNVKLSDLETLNFSLSWLFLIGVLVYSVILTVESGVKSHGAILAILMYVFNYIENIIMLPLFYQQYLRLKEITDRLQSE